MEKNKYCIQPMDLRVFDGEGGAAMGGDTGGSESTQPNDMGGSEQTVVYGKIDKGSEGNAPDAEVQDEKAKAKERQAAWEKAKKEEYKDLYDSDVQTIINRRFKETKGLQEANEAQQAILEKIAGKYGISDVSDLQSLEAAIEKDDDLWASRAEEAGMSVEQFKKVDQLERENARLNLAKQQSIHEQMANEQVRTWMEDAESLKEAYPDFDLSSEMENPNFVQLLKSNIDVETAYKVTHLSDIQAHTAESAARATERSVTNRIRQKGLRPPENGANGGNAGVIVKSDPAKWTDKDFDEVYKRVLNGEEIHL